MISNHIHDKVKEGDLVELTAPTDNFKLAEDLGAPNYVDQRRRGINALNKHAEQFEQKNHEHPVTWVHACRNKSVHAFREKVNKLIETDLSVVLYHKK